MKNNNFIKVTIMENKEFRHLGNFAAPENPWHHVYMICDDCNVGWVGCWDNFQCPECGEGELPQPFSVKELVNKMENL